MLAATTIEFLQSVKIETKSIRESTACLLVEGSLGLQTGVMIVEAEVPAFGRDSIAGVIVKRCHSLLQLVSRVAFRKLLVSQLHLLLYKLFHFRCIHILQPEPKNHHHVKNTPSAMQRLSRFEELPSPQI